jgi:hypothetical protein
MHGALKGRWFLKFIEAFVAVWLNLSSELLRRVGWGIVVVQIYKHEFIGTILHYFASG